MSGTLYGVGLGPGDPELITCKAARLIEAADVVAYHHAPGKPSIARRIAAGLFPAGVIEEPLAYPVTTGTTSHPGGYRGAMNEFYDACASTLSAHLDAGRTVVVISEGDPFTFGSYQHLHRRLAAHYPCEVVPGVTSFAAAAAAHGTPLVENDQVLTIIPGTLPSAQLVTHLGRSDAAVIMKLGRNAAPATQAIADTGRLADALYAERVGHDTQKLARLAQIDPADAPYMSLAIIPGADPQNLHGQVAESAASAVGGERSTPGRVSVVGLGPGPEDWRTPEATAVLASADVVMGYATYMNWAPVRPGQRRVATDNGDEMQRARDALEAATAGEHVAVVSSGDAGIFAMATAVVEAARDERFRGVEVQVCPGVTAASAAASRVGAPLGHDFAVISLSDRLKTPDAVLARVRACATADMAMAWYNPASRSRRDVLDASIAIVAEVRGKDCPVIVARSVGRTGEDIRITTAGAIDTAAIDMACLLIVGASTTATYETPTGTRVFTSREYRG